jgi:hypothetical protein
MKTFGYQQTLSEPEDDLLSAFLERHDCTMKIITTRGRNLGLIYSIWHNREIKVTIRTLQ